MLFFSSISNKWRTQEAIFLHLMGQHIPFWLSQKCLNSPFTSTSLIPLCPERLMNWAKDLGSCWMVRELDRTKFEDWCDEIVSRENNHRSFPLRESWYQPAFFSSLCSVCLWYGKQWPSGEGCASVPGTREYVVAPQKELCRCESDGILRWGECPALCGGPNLIAWGPNMKAFSGRKVWVRKPENKEQFKVKGLNPRWLAWKEDKQGLLNADNSCQLTTSQHGETSVLPLKELNSVNT